VNRGPISDLRAPIAIGDMLPAIYRDLDANVQRLTQGFDAVLAPVWLVLDNLDAYFDPALAPDDFVRMLAGWVGLDVDDNWTDDQRRRLVANAIDLYRWKGTRRGVIALVEAYTGFTPVVSESGGTVWSATRNAPPPGSAPGMRVTLQLPIGAQIDVGRLTRLITESVPAHVRVAVEVKQALRPDLDDLAVEN
jgi:phage tail-like protein